MSLTSEQFARVERLYFAAQKLAASDWPKFLDEQCADDEQVRAEVRELLDHHREARSIKPLTALPVDAPAQLIGKRIGSYLIVELIGEGGMGLVFRAEQERPVRRTVALKLIRAGMDSADVVARFESERQALAMMNHPNVARVFDAGTSDDGRHYFVMEYVNGQPVNTYCDHHRLSTAERLEIFLQICDAVHHAHQRGIIHRDLKPSNMLVATIDGKPVTKVIDFGIAKAIDKRLSPRQYATEVGQLIGTPEYMSPEQAEMSGLDVDTRSDIYSAGVVLYELLCGALPFDRAQWKQMPFDRVVQMIREVDPPPPSTRLGNLTDETSVPVAQSRQTEPSRLVRSLRGELDWITMKALEKDPARRYTSAAQLADDVQRYLDYEPVLAGPPSATYRVKKFVRRHRVPVIAAAVVVLALMIGAVATAYQTYQALKQKTLAEKRFNDVRKLARTMIFDVDNALEKSGVVKGREVLVHTALTYLDELSKEKDIFDDPEFAREIIKGYDRVGRVQYFPGAPSLDSPPGALASYRKALDLAQQLLARHPNDKAAQDDLPYRWMMVADASQVVDGPNVSREHYMKAADAAQKLVDRDPKNTGAKRAIAIASGRIGMGFRDQHNGPEAMRWLERQLSVNESLSHADPENAEIRRTVAHAHASIGRVLVEMGDPARALDHLKTSRSIHVAVSGESPEQNIYRRQVNNSLAYIAHAQAESLMLDDALQTATHVVERCTPAAEKDRSDLVSAQDLAAGHFQVAKILFMRGQLAEALVACNLALEIQRPLADKTGSSLQSRDALAQMDELLVELLVALGRADDALAAAMRAQLIIETNMKFKRELVGHIPQISDVDHALGIAKLAIGRTNEAVSDLQLEVDARQRLADAGATLASDRYKHVIGLLTLADAQLAMKKLPEAESTTLLARDRAKRLVADAPSSNKFAALLACAQVTLAEILVQSGKSAEAVEAQKDALKYIDPLTRSFPSYAEAQRTLKRTQSLAATPR